MSADATEANDTLFEIPGAPSEGVLESDPLWYALAARLVPLTMHHGERLAWIDGFVAACEAASGRANSLAEAGMIRETLSL